MDLVEGRARTHAQAPAPVSQRKLACFRALLTVSAVAACSSPQDFSISADRDVNAILGGSAERLEAERRATIVQPQRAQAPDAEQATGVSAPLVGPLLRRVTLAESLEIAIESNREYIGAREGLYQSALSLTGTRHGFSPLVSSSLSYAIAGGEHTDETQNAALTAGVTQALRTGGDLSVSGSATLSDNLDQSVDPTTLGTGASIRLAQPLLRGAGQEVAYEALTQAERNLMYAIREFELFRESFSIDVATRYYGLVRQRQEVENQRRNIDGLVFARRQAEALFQVGRGSQLEVLRARRSELESQNTLIETSEGYGAALDRFRIFLGLPENVRIEVEEQAPTFVTVDYDVDSAVEVALANRLDVLTRTEQLEDVERSVRIARNGLLPNLDFDASYGVASDTVPIGDSTRFDNGSWSLGFNLELPVDRLNERNAYRSAQISYSRAKREYENFLQDLVVDIRSTFRGLVRSTQSLDIQRQLIADQERNVKIAQIQLERGEVSNREVLDAQESLLQARNRLIQEQVDYEIARLSLIRDLGVLFIDENGMWIE